MLLGVLAGLPLTEARREIDRGLRQRTRLGDAFDRPVHTYSQGMRARLGLAVIQAIAPEVLLLDEVFEALDHEFRAIVEEYGRELRSAAASSSRPATTTTRSSGSARAALWLDGGRVREEGPFAEVSPPTAAA